MNEEIILQQEKASQINARFQEVGISLEGRVAALEDAVRALLENNESVDAQGFEKITECLDAAK